MADRNSSIRMRPCTVDEFEQVLRYLDTQFAKKEPRWFAHYKEHIFLPTPQSVKHHRLVTDDKGIAGMIGIYPFRITVGKAKLTVGGVGSVSVRGDTRGQGLMSA
ncbi:MAG: GNAT family N-acetyltransferase, partial [Chitinivibrionales bacterium]|nr:GNAT family N-acetyltransferase [Chitinivibrionales bacterium]